MGCVRLWLRTPVFVGAKVAQPVYVSDCGYNGGGSDGGSDDGSFAW